MYKSDFQITFSRFNYSFSQGRKFCNQNYIIYNFSTGHVLYVKDTFTLPQQINIEGRLIDSVKEIKGGDFYLKLNSKSALPL